MKKNIVIIIIIIVLLNLFIVPNVSAKTKNTYKMTVTVYKIDNNIITFKSKNNNLWQAYNIGKKWKINQKARLSMNNNNTHKNIYDDYIINIKKIKK